MKSIHVDFSILVIVLGVPLQIMSLLFFYLQYEIPTHYLSRFLTDDISVFAPYYFLFNMFVIVVFYFISKRTGIFSFTIDTRTNNLFVMYFVILVAIILLIVTGGKTGARSLIVQTAPELLIMSWLITLFPAIAYLKNNLRISINVLLFMLSSMFVNIQLGGFGGAIKPVLVIIFIEISYRFSIRLVFRYMTIVFFLLMTEPLIFGHFDEFALNIFTKSYFDRYLNSLLFISAAWLGEINLQLESYFSVLPFSRYFMEFESTRDIFNMHFAGGRYENGYSFPVLYTAELLVLFGSIALFAPIIFLFVYFFVVQKLSYIKYYDFGLVLFLYSVSNLPFMMSSYVATFYKSLFLAIAVAGVFCTSLFIKSVITLILPKKRRTH